MTTHDPPSTRYVVLSDSIEPHHHVDDPLFTDVTDNGETYTLFRIEQITHRIVDHPKGWNYLATARAINIDVAGIAFLKVQDRTIVDCKVERFDRNS